MRRFPQRSFHYLCVVFFFLFHVIFIRHTSFLSPLGGDGPKMIDLLQMRETHFLQDRITLLGPVAHRDVPSVCASSIWSRILTHYIPGSPTRLHFHEYLSHRIIWYRDIRGCVCRLACGLHSRRRGSRDSSRRHDIFRRSQCRRLILSSFGHIPS